MRALILDTETTGLLDNHLLPLKKQPEVIEWYGQIADLTTGEIGLTSHYLIKPSQPLSEEVIRITGITQEELDGRPNFVDIADMIATAIAVAPMAIAHNLSYDKEMIDLEFERLGRKVRWPNVQICTVESTVHFKGYRLSLGALHEYLFGEPMKEAHRAIADVKALTRCAVELFRRGDL